MKILARSVAGMRPISEKNLCSQCVIHFADTTMGELLKGLSTYFAFYNEEPPH
ncbi:hypothetical protein MCERE10_02402 [Burkholderiaceae bacterium]